MSPMSKQEATEARKEILKTNCVKSVDELRKKLFATLPARAKKLPTRLPELRYQGYDFKFKKDKRLKHGTYLLVLAPPRATAVRLI